MSNGVVTFDPDAVESKNTCRLLVTYPLAILTDEHTSDWRSQPNLRIQCLSRQRQSVG